MIMSVGYYFFFRKLPVLWRDVNKESLFITSANYSARTDSGNLHKNPTLISVDVRPHKNLTG